MTLASLKQNNPDLFKQMIGENSGQKIEYTKKEIYNESKHEKLRAYQAEREVTLKAQQMTESDNTLFDIDYQKRIHQKILEGKSDIEIAREILKEDQKGSLNQNYSKQEKGDIDEEFQDIKDKDFKGIMDIPFAKRHEDQIEKLAKIKQSTDYIKDLTELPYQEHIQKHRKLTQGEKEDIETELANIQKFKELGGQKVDGKYPEYAKKGIEYTRVDDKPSKEQITKLQDQTYLQEVQKQQEIEKEKRRLKRVTQKLKLDALDFDQLKDDPLNQLAEKDNTKSFQIQEKQINNFQIQPAKSFVQREERFNWLLEKYNLDIEEAEQFEYESKKSVFAAKKLQEDNYEYKKYLNKKERQKEFMKYSEMLHAERTKIKDNYEEDVQAEEKQKKSSKKQFEDLLKTSEQPDFSQFDQKQFFGQEEEEELEGDEKRYDNYKRRYERNVQRFLNDYFFQRGGSQNEYLAVENSIQIEQIIMNDACTQINVFYKAYDSSKYNTEDQDPFDIPDNIKQLIQQRLQTHSKFLAGKLCQALYLRYTPELNFYESKRGKVKPETEAEIHQIAKDIAKSRLQQQYGLKKISKEELQKLEEYVIEQMYSKVEDESNENEAQLIKQKQNKVQKDEKGNRIRNNKDDEGKKIKKKKKDKKSDIFWNNLQD